MSTPSHRIFYAWQSELPNGTNRGLIERALTEAVKSLKDGVVEPAMDRDTLGIPGTPDIAQTIFEKIDACEIFVADISLVQRDLDDAFRPTPNPNVLIELGYAAKSLGWDRVILVFNGAHGEIEDLPFDIRARRITRYDAKEGQPNSEARKKLADVVTSALEGMLREPPRRTPREPRLRLEWVVDPPGPPDLHEGPRPATLSDGVLVLPPAAVQEPGDLRKLGLGRLTLRYPMSDYEQTQEAIMRHINSMANGDLVSWYVRQMLPSEGRTFRLSVLNDGGQPATEIKIEIALGDFFKATHLGRLRHRYTSDHDALIYSSPALDRPQMDEFGARMFTSEVVTNIEIEDSSIKVRTSKTLLHHHKSAASQRIMLGALPGAQPGVYDLQYSVFARELPTKMRGVLRIKVASPAKRNAT